MNLALWIREELTEEYKLISRDEFDTCANYARLVPGGVEIETLFRYGNPTRKVVSIETFKNLREKDLV